jgi:hypothetical protein
MQGIRNRNEVGTQTRRTRLPAEEDRLIRQALGRRQRLTMAAEDPYAIAKWQLPIISRNNLKR